MKFTRHCLAALAAVVVVGIAANAQLFTPLDNALADLRFQLAPRAASGDIVFVEIDPRSLNAVGRWPWLRSHHGRLVENLVAAGAQEIAFDVDFSSPSSNFEDAAFERALAEAGGIVALPTFRQRWSGADKETVLHVNEPIARFARHTWSAMVNVVPEGDGRVRALSYGDTINGEFRPSIAGLYGGLPSDGRATFTVDFSIDPTSVPRLSYIDVFGGDAAAMRQVAGRKILIGSSADELGDSFAVPVHAIVPGAMLQILGAESILQGRALAPISFNAVLAGLFAIGAFAMVLCRFVAWRARLACLFGVAAAIEGTATAIQLGAPVIVESVAWHAAILVLAVATIFSEMDLRRLLLRVARTETRNVRELLGHVVATNFDGILVIEESGRVVEANASAAASLGLKDQAGLEGAAFADVLPMPLADHVRSVLKAFGAGASADRRPVEIACDIGGQRVVFELLATPSRLDPLPGVAAGTSCAPAPGLVCVTFRDVTERNRTQSEIAYMAHYDSLTGLANRNRLNESLALALSERRSAGEGLAVIYFDLDRFKNVNDTLGHHIGDLLLKTVAERASAVVGKRGFVARFGGDEFVAVLSQVGALEEARQIATALVERLRVPYILDGHHVIVGTSAGLAWSEDGDPDASEVVRNADAALHKAKTLGGNMVGMFEAGMGERLKTRRKLELDLWHAFEKGEFEVFFQPQVDLATGMLNGAEALVRWRRADGGYVSPAEFIPAVEDIGLMTELGSWILDSAVAEAARWAAPVKVAVNLSSHQFRTGDLVGAVEKALARNRLAPSRLDLEITESLLVDESPVTSAILERLREMGVGLALDDFGTGYSSLSYIRRFPITKIKIDQSFVRGLPGDKGALAIVRAVTALSSSLDLATTAEGIETVDQMTLLRLCGCDQGQGFLFGRPLSAKAFAELVASNEPGTALVA